MPWCGGDIPQKVEGGRDFDFFGACIAIVRLGRSEVGHFRSRSDSRNHLSRIGSDESYRLVDDYTHLRRGGLLIVSQALSGDDPLLLAYAWWLHGEFASGLVLGALARSLRTLHACPPFLPNAGGPGVLPRH